MRIDYKAILRLLIVILICTTQYYGQTADLQFVVIQNDQSVNGTYAVMLQIKLDTEANMGTSSLQFTFNSAGLNLPDTLVENTDYEYHNYQGAISITPPFIIYQSTVTRPITGKVSINIVLSTLDGQTITTDWMDIVTISFTISDINESSNLQWIPETTTIFDDLNNPIPNNTLNNLDTPLPVELSSFTASVDQDIVELNWETKTEVNNYGFNIERRINEEKWTTLGFVEGYGNSNSPKEYSYTDNDLFAGGIKFQYRLKQIDNDGQFEYSDVVEVSVLPTKFELSQNFPNPFNPSTTIRFSLPKETQLKINIYNMLGELVETLAEKTYEAGYHKVTFNASTLSSGAYIYRIENSEFVQTKKMLLIK